MLITYIEDNEMHHVQGNPEDLSFPFLGESICLTKHHPLQWCCPDNIELENPGTIEDGRIFEFHNKTTHRRGTVYISQQDEGLNTFQKYTVTHKDITIGYTPLDLIMFQDERMYQKRICIDFEKKEIHVDPNIPCALNGKLVKGSVSFQAKDCFECLSLCIFFEEFFIMVNSLKNVTIHLDPWKVPNELLRLPTQKNLNITQRLEKQKLEDTFIAKIDAKYPLEQKEKYPIWITMGPLLMMSLATLSIGIFNAYRNYMEGNDVFESIPTLILPITMVISTVCFTPLQRYYEKKQYRELLQNWEKDVSQQINEISMKYAAFLETYNDQANKIAPCIYHLNERMKVKFQIEKKSILNLKDIKVSLGKRTNIIHIEWDISSQTNQMKLAELSIFHDLKDQLNTPIEMPWIISLEDYSRIYLEETEDQELYLWNLLFQILYAVDDTRVKVLFLETKEWLESHPILYSIPHIYSHHQTLLFLELNELYTYLESVNKDETFSFLLVTSEDIPFDKCDSMITMIRIGKRKEPIPNGIMLSMQCNKGYGIAMDYRKNENIIFHYDLQENHIQGFESFLALFPKEISFHQNPSFLDLYSCKTINQLPILKNYKEMRCCNGIYAILGLDENEKPITINLHESGDGPHGLIAGSTGSGKSELLVTMLLSLAVNYSPEELQFVILDFKGGGLIESFQISNKTIPHLISSLSNLDTSQMKRALIALEREVVRREKLFQQFSKCIKIPIKDIDSFQKNWHENTQLPYLSHLIVLVDEFAELKQEHPEFMERLISLSRVGRSLGIHLILSTQKPSGIVSDQISSNCHFKISMKMNEKMDSQEVLHTSDAYYLQHPGEFILQVDQTMKTGMAGYSHAIFSNNKPEVSILDCTLNHVRKESVFDCEIPEIAFVHKEISSFSKRSVIHTLWQPPLPHCTRNSKLPKDAIFVKDQIYKNCYEVECVKDSSKSIYAIFTKDKKALQNFIYSVLYAAIYCARDKDEIYILDDAGIIDSALLHASIHLIDILTLDDQEKLHNLYHHILDSKDRNFTILITDMGTFLNEYVEERDVIYRLLKQCEKYNLCVYNGFASISDCPARMESYLHQKIVLKMDSIQDISAIFGKKADQTIKDAFAGFVLEEELLEIQIIETKLNDFNYDKKLNKIYRIPCLPDTISYKNCDLDGLPLGIQHKDYQWLTLKKGESLMILSMYKEEWQDFLRVIKQHPLWEEYHKQIQFHLISECSLTNLNTMLTKGNLLYIGSSYERQYFITSSIRRLKKGEALYVSPMNCEVISYVQQ